MAALKPAQVRILETLRKVFMRARYKLSVYDFQTDDRAFLRPSGSFNFCVPGGGEDRSGFVRIVGGNSDFKIDVFLTGFKKRSVPIATRGFYSHDMYWKHRTVRKDMRSVKVRKFATYALSAIMTQLDQLEVEEVHQK